jgi:hypothetical protein
MLACSLTGCFIYTGRHYDIGGAMLADVHYSGVDGPIASGIEVSGTNFTAIFKPIIYDPDYEFMMWNKNAVTLCGGSTNPTCRIDATPFTGHEAIANYLATSEGAALVDPIVRPKKCGFTGEDFRVCRNHDIWKFARYDDEVQGRPYYWLSVSGDLFIDEGAVLNNISIGARNVYINAGKNPVRFVGSWVLSQGHGGYINGVRLQVGSFLSLQPPDGGGQSRRFAGLTIENVSLESYAWLFGKRDRPVFSVAYSNAAVINIKNVTGTVCAKPRFDIQRGSVKNVNVFDSARWASSGYNFPPEVKTANVTITESAECSSYSFSYEERLDELDYLENSNH